MVARVSPGGTGRTHEVGRLVVLRAAPTRFAALVPAVAAVARWVNRAARAAANPPNSFLGTTPTQAVPRFSFRSMRRGIRP